MYPTEQFCIEHNVLTDKYWAMCGKKYICVADDKLYLTVERPVPFEFESQARYRIQLYRKYAGKEIEYIPVP